MKAELTINQHIKYNETVKFDLPNAQAAAIVIDILSEVVPPNSNTTFTINVFDEEEAEDE